MNTDSQSGSWQRHARVDRGLCSDCGEPHHGGTWRCQKCRDRLNNKRRGRQRQYGSRPVYRTRVNIEHGEDIRGGGCSWMPKQQDRLEWNLFLCAECNHLCCPCKGSSKGLPNDLGDDLCDDCWVKHPGFKE